MHTIYVLLNSYISNSFYLQLQFRVKQGIQLFTLIYIVKYTLF